MSHHEKDRPLDPALQVTWTLPENELFSPPVPDDLERDLNNAWLKSALNQMTGQMGALHRTIIRNQWWLIAAVAVNTVLVLILAALVWVGQF